MIKTEEQNFCWFCYYDCIGKERAYKNKNFLGSYKYAMYLFTLKKTPYFCTLRNNFNFVIPRLWTCITVESWFEFSWIASWVKVVVAIQTLTAAGTLAKSTALSIVFNINYIV